MLEQLLAVVKSKPEDLEQRKNLREAERKQITEQKLKSFSFKWGGIKTKGRSLAEVLAECEDFLSKTPYDISVLLTLGKTAALEEPYWETAIYTLYDVAALVNMHITEYKEAESWRYEVHKELGNLFVKKEDYSTALTNYRMAESYAETDEKHIEIDKLIKDAEAKAYTKKVQDDGGKESQKRRTEEGQRIKQDREEELQRAAKKPKQKTPLDEAVELYELKDYVSALEKLQQTVKMAASEINAKSHLYIGLCYESLSADSKCAEIMQEFAESHYTSAFEAANKTNDENLRLEILYTRGTLYAEAGEQVKAMKDFMEIFDTDVNYRNIKEIILK